MLSTFQSLARSSGAWAFVLVVGVVAAPCSAGAVELPQRIPASSSNAALHYHRAILLMADVDLEQRALLKQPIWELVHPEMSEAEVARIDALLVASRHAVRAAIAGASQPHADFGVDFRAYSAATRLPHVGLMQKLARVLTLHGLQKQSEGDWRQAAMVYLDVMHMGKHMSEQLTLAEAIEAVRILETGYYVLATWAAECPDAELVASTLSALNVVVPEHLSPTTALGYESSLLLNGLTAIGDDYPEGAWAEAVLDLLDITPEARDPETMRAAAVAAAIERGVPETVFESDAAFAAHLELLREVNQDYYEAMVQTVSLPTKEALEAGKRVFDEFSPKLKRLGDEGPYSPTNIVAYYATHEAEHHLLQIVLGLCAEKQGGLFPADLAGVTARFGGMLPASPYDGQPASYETTADRTGFSVSYPAFSAGGVDLPEVKFAFGTSKGE
ncbi:MAG: hypothetical protein AAGA92_10090 [Planctomycetota bacterium]